MKILRIIILILLLQQLSAVYSQTPNILFIIADDMGVDALEGFKVGEQYPNTPNIDKLRDSGVTFTNVWGCPVCSATRASIITGKYGHNNGVNTVPGILSTEHKSIFKELKDQSNGKLKTCVVGKWHLARKRDYDQVFKHGIDDFMGVMGAGVSDYYNWEKYEDGKADICNTYATEYLTDYAINWINKQENPWLMWMAHFAPHTPFHIPPEGTFTTKNVDANCQKYKAMIESLDYEIGRLLHGINKEVLENTVVIFLGDNGTPGRIITGFPKRRGKQTIYQGGISVPLVISGNGVTRKNEVDDALINISDFYTTLAQIINPNAFPEGNTFDSYSFKNLLGTSGQSQRRFNYMELGANHKITNSSYTVRNIQYKLLDMGNDSFELYDLLSDPFEQNNLLCNKLNSEQTKAYTELLNEMEKIRGINLSTNPEKEPIKKTSGKYPIVHTGVNEFYDSNSKIVNPNKEKLLYWQDAGRVQNKPSYTNNSDGTITDNITGLIWQQDMGKKMTYEEAVKEANSMSLGGYNDWRIPNIKELYSLIQFNGRVMGAKAIDPFIDTKYFIQPEGDESKGERSIDAQTWSSTSYTGKTMHNNKTIFGVNFIDGRIKGYPEFKRKANESNKMYFRMVRGNSEYGKNQFIDNGDGTVTDYATGLMWQKADDGKARDWESAIEYAENLELAGYNDWHLPNIKELQSIVDYTRSPSTTNSAAIDPVFNITEINDPEGTPDFYPYFWSTTTHLDGPNPYGNATYIAFGEALGKMRGQLMDVHGAGAQRSDPKSGDSAEFPKYRGPQGDLLLVYNYCRCVRRVNNVLND